jgi:hypothetical protein
LVPDADLLIDGVLGQRTRGLIARLDPDNVRDVLRTEQKNHYMRWLAGNRSFRNAQSRFLARARA